MGINEVVARLDEGQAEQVETQPDEVIHAIIRASVGDPPVDRILNFASEGHMVQACLRAHLGPDAADYVSGEATGKEVGEDTGYGRARLLPADRVRHLAGRFAELPEAPFPTPNPYAADPRIDDDPKIHEVWKYLDLCGVDTDSEEEMEQLGRLLGWLRDLYAKAAEAGDPLLVLRC